MSDGAEVSKLSNRMTVFLRLQAPSVYYNSEAQYHTATIGGVGLDEYRKLAKQAERIIDAKFEVRAHGDGVKIWRMK
jgi:hypothetical protein